MFFNTYPFKNILTLLICTLILSACGDDEVRLYLTIDGKGTIKLNNTAYDTNATITYEEDAIVQVQSDPNIQWEFVNYTGDLTGTSSSQNLTMNADKHVTATFKLKDSVSINGYITDENDVAIQGVLITSGSGANQVSGTTDSNGAYSIDNVPVPTNDRVYLNISKAGFLNQSYYFDQEKSEMTLKTVKLTRVYNLYVLNNYYNYGSTSPVSGTYTLTENHVKSLTATHDNTLLFEQWSGHVPSTENATSISIAITMDKNRTVVAQFKRLTTYTLHIHCDPERGAVTQSPENTTHVAGTEIQLNNTSEEGYIFSYWINHKGHIVDSTPLTFNLNENTEYTCVFNDKSYQLTVNQSGEGKITPTFDSNSYINGTTVTLTAIAAYGWKFRKWQGSLSSTNNQVNIVMDADKSLTAIFEKPWAQFMGQVRDQAGQWVSNVKVMAGQQYNVSDTQGYFFLDRANIPTGSDTMMLLFQKQGYCLHSETFQVDDQILIENIYPQLSQNCKPLESIINTLKILTQQQSTPLTFDIEGNERADLSEVIFMMQHLSAYSDE